MKFIKAIWLAVSVFSVGFTGYGIYKTLTEKNKEDLVSSLSKEEKKKIIISLLAE